ncbi:MAG: trigger factor, partial [Oscillospiraceae bacterium]|nr:trigger factor [Oscillospiraceae bacterium]
KADFEKAVMDVVIAQTEMDIPETMVEYETDKMMENYESRLQGSGLSFDQYLNMMGTNRAEFRTTTKLQAQRQIQVELVLKAVAEAEAVEVSEEEIEAHVKELAEQYGMEIEKVKEVLSADVLKRDVQMDKTSKIIYDSAIAE